MTEVAGREILELHFENADGRVRVIPPDNSILAMSVETAIEACRAFRHQIEFKNQFDMLLHHLGEWISNHKDKVNDAYLTTCDTGLLFLVVMQGEAFDDDLEADLTALQIEIANDNDYSHIDLDVLAAPNVEGAADSFISKRLRLRYRIDGK